MLVGYQQVTLAAVAAGIVEGNYLLWIDMDYQGHLTLAGLAIT